MNVVSSEKKWFQDLSDFWTAYPSLFRRNPLYYISSLTKSGCHDCQLRRLPVYFAQGKLLRAEKADEFCFPGLSHIT